MAEATEQQGHLKQLVQQEAQLMQEVNNKTTLLNKVRGAIEYLTETGVTLPEPEPEAVPEGEVPTPETEVVPEPTPEA